MMTRTLLTLTLLATAVAPWAASDLTTTGRVAELLDVTEAPVAADVVVVFAGGGGSRVEHAARLVEAGFARRIMILGTAPEKECAVSLLRRWFPDGGAEVILPRVELPDTDTSARFAARWLEARGLRRALIVSSDWHLRRIRLLMGRYGSWTGAPALRFCAPATAAPSSPAEDAARTRVAIAECVKLVGSAILSLV